MEDSQYQMALGVRRSERSPTLIVGGSARTGTFRVDPAELSRGHAPPPDERFREAVLAEPLESFDSPWHVLRSIRDWLLPGGILTVESGVDRVAVPLWAVRDLLTLAGFETVHTSQKAGLRRTRGRRIERELQPLSCSVIVPCRNEVGNVDGVVRRTPSMGIHTELIFVDGNSTDGTADRIEALIASNPARDIKLLRQSGPGGKAVAVFQGFDAAGGDVVMILDADMTVAPEDLPIFFTCIAEGVADFANGTRFAFPMEEGAMQPLNNAGNRAFGTFLSWLLGSTITDSLCGTKAFRRRDWLAIRDARPLFGGHDPWGDFDLLLGAAHAGMRLQDVPIRYHARREGESKMRPFQHGLSLAMTCLAGVRALKLGLPGGPGTDT